MRSLLQFVLIKLGLTKVKPSTTELTISITGGIVLWQFIEYGMQPVILVGQFNENAEVLGNLWQV